MLKRQDSFLSSSSRRENTPPSKQPAKPVGCMSGIFRIFSKFQLHRRRKFLTFGNRQANAKPSEAKIVSVLPKSDENKSLIDDEEGERICGGLSCEIPRSPSLAQLEIRGAKSQDHFMITSSTPPPARWLQERKNTDLQPEISSSAENRRKLLNALDKCDHDLKALKKIIQSVQFEEVGYNSPTSTTKTSAWPRALVTTPSAAAAAATTKHSTTATAGHDFTLSSLSKNNSIYSRRHGTTRTTTSTGSMTQQHKLSVRKKQDDLDASFLKKFTEVLLNSRYRPTCSSSWSSKAMIESVDEVCGDIDWGEKREVKRLGLELQDFICTDLIEEIVKEFGYFSIYSLPFQACRRKLQF